MKYLRLCLVLVLFGSIVSSCLGPAPVPKQKPLKESEITLMGQSLEEIISESDIKDGDFNGRITYDNFPYTPTSGVVKVVKVCLGYKISQKLMREFLDRKGLQGANIGQLLVYRPQYLEIWPARLLALSPSLKKYDGLSYCPFVSTSWIWNDLELYSCSDNDFIFGDDCVLAVPKR